MKVNQTTPSDKHKKRPYIARDTSQEDHGHHDTEEYNNDERVDQTEPMYTWVEDMEVIVPARCLKKTSTKWYKKYKDWVHSPKVYQIAMNE